MNDSTSKYLGIPYVSGGRGFSGTDCYGLVVLWFHEELGTNLFDPRIALRREELQGITHFMTGLDDWVEVEPAQARRNDVVLMLNGSTTPNHCGVVIDNTWLLHILEGPGCSLARIARWRPRIHKFYRYKGLAT